ncbi:MAG TPA: hypothetical protein VM118_11040 [Acidobacteriota bacterium]|nr:hypothetical protein [Acidobacteriota bacterium]
MINLPIADIIRDGFKLAWRYKYLWLFGLFAAGGVRGNVPGLGSDDSGIPDVEAAKAWFMAALAMILLLVFTIGLVILILHVISKTALIYNVYQIETGGTHSISGGWDFGWKRFWPMLGLTLLLIVISIAFVLGIVMVVVALFAVAAPLGVLSLLFGIPLIIGGLVILVLTWTYAERFAVLELRGVIDSIGDGWLLLREQWKPTILMGLAKFAIAIGVFIVVTMIAMMLALPGIALWATAKPLAILYGIGALIPLIVFAAYIGTFDSAVWTKTFLLLRAPAYAHAAEPADTPPTPGPPAPPADSPPPRPPQFE